jgi:hypothetical protein
MGIGKMGFVAVLLTRRTKIDMRGSSRILWIVISVESNDTR